MHPAASAGPILRVAMAAGKFHGVMSTETPTGSWVTTDPLVAAGRCAVVADDPARPPRRTTGRTRRRRRPLTGLGENLAVLAGDELGEALGLRGEQFERPPQDLGALPGRAAAQPGSAACAAATAASQSSSPAVATSVMASPVAGSCTAIRPEPGARCRR